MIRLPKFFVAHKVLLLSSIFLAVFAVTVSYAAPLLSPYTPGQTLNPNCAPGETNCTVAVGGGGSSPWGTVTGGINYAGGNVGIGTTTPSAALDLEGDGTVLAVGADGSGLAVPDLGGGTRMEWIPSKSAFRAGTVNDVQWDSANVGDGSVAFGTNTTASGGSSAAFGAGNSASGYGSAAFGITTIASGYGSAAFGEGGNTASGEASFVGSGQSNTASGRWSVSFGNATTASGDSSTTFGDFTTASGDSSAAFGLLTNANSLESFVTGQYNVGGGDPSNWIGTDPLFEVGNGVDNTQLSDALAILKNGNVGINTATPQTMLDLEGDGTVLAVGTDGSGAAVPDLGAGTRMMWIPSKSAFRVGIVDGTQWDSVNVGDASMAFGYDTKAPGIYSTAFGAAGTASGALSTVFGAGTTASGSASTAFGQNSTASAADATAFGYVTTASGTAATAFGESTTASNQDTLAFGNSTQAIAAQATAFGFNTTASGFASTAFGNNSTASYDDATAWGESTQATAYAATAFGFSTLASNDKTTAWGESTIASGIDATALGIGTSAAAYDSLASGRYNVGGGTAGSWVTTDPLFEVGNGADGTHLADAFSILKNGSVGINTATPHAELDLEKDGSILAVGTQGSGIAVPDLGAGTRMMWIPYVGAFRAGTADGTEWNSANVGQNSVAFGHATTASGSASTAFGDSTIASGEFSVAIGNGGLANAFSSIVIGGGNAATGRFAISLGNSSEASGDDSMTLGYQVQAQSVNDIALGVNNIGGGNATTWIGTDPLLEIGNGNPSGSTRSNALTILKNGDTGIGNAVPAHLLDVGSTSVVTGTAVAQFINAGGTCTVTPSATGGITCTSDMTLKKNITTLADNSSWSFNNNITGNNSSVLDKVVTLTPVSYNWNVEQDSDPKHAGFIAQEVGQIFPDLVSTDPATHLLSLNYSGLVPYTVEAVKEMNLKIVDISNLTKQNSWRDSIVAWLGSASNGIDNIFSNKITTNQLCVGSVCVTQDQFLQMVQNSQHSAQGTTITAPPVANDSDASASESADQSVPEANTQSTDTAPLPASNTQSSNTVTPDVGTSQ